MPKAKNAKVDEALALFRQGLKLKEIAARLEVPEGTIRRWKHSYDWESERSKKPNVRKRGAQRGNKNGKGALPGNQNARKFGFMVKYLPDETMEIVKATEDMDPLDLLWDNIRISYAAILRAQRIAFVKDQEDKTVEATMEGPDMTAYAIQQAWEKQAAFMKAQTRAQSELRSMIKQYDELLHARHEMATEEQRARIEKLRAETERMKNGGDPDIDDGVVIINDAPGS